MLLAVDERDAIHIIVLIVVCILVSTHDELLLGALQADRTNRFITLLRNVDVCHVLASAAAAILLMTGPARHAT